MKSLSALALVLVLFPACRQAPGSQAAAILQAEQAALPPFSVPIVVMDGAWKDIGFANAVLIDRELGVLASNAHVAAFGPRFKVRIGASWYGVEPISSCISWHADLAFFRISRLDRFVLPAAAELHWRTFAPSEEFQVASYVLEEPNDNGLVIKTQTVTVSLLKEKSDWGISLMSGVERIELLYRRYMGETIPNVEVHKLYENFLAVKISDKRREELPWDYDMLRPGTSGSAVVDKDGKVVGIHSSANSGRALAVPAFEVQRLLAKYRRELKQNKSR